MLTTDLSDRAILVTGGASGIGLATVEAFARCGARVAINHLAGDARAEAEAARLTQAGHRVTLAPGNVADPEGARAMVDAVVQRFGRLDVLVNNAGTPGAKEPIPFEDLDAMTEDFWGTILSTNLIGPFRCARAAAPALKAARGAIVNTASVAGLGRRGSSVAYAASKAGVVNLTRSLARALAPEVRVNAVAPGLIDTPWTNPWPDARKAATMERTLLGRLGKPAEIAQAILFLAVGATYMTGETILLDGGAA